MNLTATSGLYICSHPRPILKRGVARGGIEMDQKNLDIYGNPVIPWSRALEALEAETAKTEEAASHKTWWLGTTRPDGRPHSAGVGAMWADGKVYFVSGPGTRKSRNLVKNPNCVISVPLTGLDLVLEGTARVVTDEPTLDRKSTRLNSSHVAISYAVFCLKK